MKEILAAQKILAFILISEDHVIKASNLYGISEDLSNL
jgi:hypothetical protein